MIKIKETKEFFCSESLDLLENSQGAAIIHALNRYDDLRKQSNEKLKRFNQLEMIIKLSKKQIQDLKESNIFVKLFTLKKIRSEISALQQKIKKAEEEMEIILEEEKAIYAEIIKCEREVQANKKTLKLYGIDISELVAEYNRIKAELEKSQSVEYNADIKAESHQEIDKGEEQHQSLETSKDNVIDAPEQQRQ